MVRLAALLFAGFLCIPAAWAISDPAEALPNPAAEARAVAIGRGLRCLVCQNESIEDSGADLARCRGRSGHPPGTSKWNRMEHRLFAFITPNWRGKPLMTHQVIIQLIASTTTQTGLTVQGRLDQNTYQTGTKVSDDQIARLNITPAEFHGQWNYTIAPRKPDS
jgi:Rhodopirellula transposase DDE domain/Cytochrome C biogenesis protein